MLAIHIFFFGTAFAAYYNPYFSISQSNYELFAWQIKVFLFEGKALNIFSMIFGASFVLYYRKYKSFNFCLNRHFILLLLGVLHSFFIWFDILIWYSLIGVFAFYLINKSTKVLLVLFLACYSILPFHLIASYFENLNLSGENLDYLNMIWNPTENIVQVEVARNTSGFVSGFFSRFDFMLFSQKDLMFIFTFWKCLACTILGVILFRFDFLNGRLKASTYLSLGLILIAIGSLLTGYGIYQFTTEKFSTNYYLSLGRIWNHFGSLFTALGIVSGFFFVYKAKICGKLFKWLEYTGRLSLTNYFLQSLMCIPIFYGYGLGLFNQYSKIELLSLSLVLFGIQMFASVTYLKYFEQGPLECLTKQLTHRLIFAKSN